MKKSMNRKHFGKGECNWCYENRELYSYDFIDYLLCKECIKNVIPEDWNIDPEDPAIKMEPDKYIMD